MPRKAKSNILSTEGEVVLVDKASVPPPPPPPVIEMSPTKYEKEVRPKKPLSEKQRENLNKLIERNKQKAIERRAIITNAIPEVIPEDKVLVRIKPKQLRKPKGVKEEPKNEVVMPSPAPTPAQSESEYSESEPEVKPRKPRKPPVRKQPPKPRPAPRYSYETETTTADEMDSDSDSEEEEYKVRKYQAKAEKRMKAVEKIDRRLKSLQNPYAERSLSVF